MKPTVFILTALVALAVVTILTAPEPQRMHREYWDIHEEVIFLDSIRADTVYELWTVSICNGDTLVPYFAATLKDTVYISAPVVCLSDSIAVPPYQTR